ncbi:MAG: hypothetical protein ACYDH3_03075 [Candidatus Aminicenantales bacterium]
MTWPLRSFIIAAVMNEHITQIIVPALLRAVVRVSFWWADLPAL